MYGAYERALFAHLWNAEQTDAAASGRRASIKKAAAEANVHLSTARRLAQKMAAGVSLEPLQRGGARNQKVHVEELLYLERLVGEARYSRDKHYAAALSRDLGLSVGRRTVAKHLKETLNTTVVKAVPQTLDKWTEESAVRFWEYISTIVDAPVTSLRFYDQTGVSFLELYDLTRRKETGGPTPTVPAPTSTGVHHSFFGVTSIRETQPPVWYSAFRTVHQNGHGTAEHVSFWQSAVNAGVLELDREVIVWDNFSGHTSAVGEILTDYLEDAIGAVVVPIPPKTSWLNSIEGIWNLAKNRASDRMIWDGCLDPLMAAPYLCASLDSISYEDVYSQMQRASYI